MELAVNLCTVVSPSFIEIELFAAPALPEGPVILPEVLLVITPGSLTSPATGLESYWPLSLT